MVEQNIHVEISSRLNADEELLWYVLGEGSWKAVKATRPKTWWVRTLHGFVLFGALLIITKSFHIESLIKIGAVLVVAEAIVWSLHLLNRGVQLQQPIEFRNRMVTSERVVVFDGAETLSFDKGIVLNAKVDFCNGAKVLAFDVYTEQKEFMQIVVGNAVDYIRPVELINSMINKEAKA